MAKLKAAEQELALYKHREQREAEAKRQKTLKKFFEKSRGLPTRPGHFDADLSKATGYSETELRRTFRADVAAVETFIESRVSDPLKQLQTGPRFSAPLLIVPLRSVLLRPPLPPHRPVRALGWAHLGQGAGWVAWESGLAGADTDRIGAGALDGRASTYVAPPPVSLQRWRGEDVG